LSRAVHFGHGIYVYIPTTIVDDQNLRTCQDRQEPLLCAAWGQGAPNCLIGKKVGEDNRGVGYRRGIQNTLCATIGDGVLVASARSITKVGRVVLQHVRGSLLIRS
jgi:hypothetical protein